MGAGVVYGIQAGSALTTNRRASHSPWMEAIRCREGKREKKIRMRALYEPRTRSSPRASSSSWSRPPTSWGAGRPRCRTLALTPGSVSSRWFWTFRINAGEECRVGQIKCCILLAGDPNEFASISRRSEVQSRAKIVPDSKPRHQHFAGCTGKFVGQGLKNATPRNPKRPQLARHRRQMGTKQKLSCIPAGYRRRRCCRSSSA